MYRGVTIPEAVPTSQITRLHKLGIAPKQIATVLERPSQEVEIVLMVEKTRRIGLIPNPCGKLSGAVDGTPVRAASNSPAEAPF